MNGTQKLSGEVALKKKNVKANSNAAQPSCTATSEKAAHVTETASTNKTICLDHDECNSTACLPDECNFYQRGQKPPLHFCHTLQLHVISSFE